MQCPNCEGTGYWIFNTGFPGWSDRHRCQWCGGVGEFHPSWVQTEEGTFVLHSRAATYTLDPAKNTLQYILHRKGNIANLTLTARAGCLDTILTTGDPDFLLQLTLEGLLP